MMKRLWAICLALVIAATTFGTVALADEAPEMRTLSVICRAKFNADNALEDRGKNLSYQVFEKELAARGVHLEYELVDDASIAQVVQTRMAAQVDVPDIIADAWIGVTENEIISWAENGLLVNVRDIVEQYDEDGSIFKFYEEHTPGVLAASTMADGGVYWFHYLNAATWVEEDGTKMDFNGNSYTPSIRLDWLEKAGVEYKKQMTHDELYDALLAIQKADGNGNGVEDEVMAVSIDGYAGLARSFGLSYNLLVAVGKDDKVYNNLYLPEFGDYIRYMQKMYQSNLYDTTALGDGMITELIADNKASLTQHYASWESFESTISATDDAVYAPIMLTTNDGKAYSAVDPLFGSYCHYMISSQCDDLEAVVDLFDYIYTDEYALLDKFGVEGVSFEYNDAGVPVNLYDPDVHPLDWEGLPLFNNVGMIAVPSINTGMQVFERNIANDYRKVKNEYTIWFQDEGADMCDIETYGDLSLKLALPTAEELEIISEVENVLTTYTKELLTDLILGNRSLDDLPEYIAELESLGLKDYMNIAQARRDRFVAAVGSN